MTSVALIVTMTGFHHAGDMLMDDRDGSFVGSIVDGLVGGSGESLVELTRRAFLCRSALVAGGAFLAGCGSIGDLTAPDSVSFSFQVSQYPALATVGGVALVDAGTPLAVVRVSADSFLALSRICPHAGGNINQNGTGFRCTRHGAMFSSTGQWTGGERTSSMRSYPTSYDSATGTVTIG